MIGIALCGTGTIARVHANAIKKAKGASLRAVYSRSPERAKSFAQRFGAKPFSDFNELLSRPEIQAVVIATENSLHYALALKALKAGKHVLVEKPIALKESDAKELVLEAKKRALCLASVSQHRFDSCFQELKRSAQNGSLGRLFLASASLRYSRGKEYYSSWRGKKEKSGGGVLLMQAIHQISLLNWLLGKPESVVALQGNIFSSGVEDLFVGAIKYKNKAVASLNATTSCTMQLPTLFELHGTLGSVLVEGKRTVFQAANPSAFRKKIGPLAGHMQTLLPFKPLPWRTIAHSPIFKNSFREQIEDFAQAIQHSRKALSSGEDALLDLQTILALYKSAETRKEVSLH